MAGVDALTLCWASASASARRARGRGAGEAAAPPGPPGAGQPSQEGVWWKLQVQLGDLLGVLGEDLFVPTYG
jgi:hypothetical protein